MNRASLGYLYINSFCHNFQIWIFFEYEDKQYDYLIKLLKNVSTKVTFKIFFGTWNEVKYFFKWSIWEQITNVTLLLSFMNISKINLAHFFITKLTWTWAIWQNMIFYYKIPIEIVSILTFFTLCTFGKTKSRWEFQTYFIVLTY